ncbi:unnamed protein product [Sphagnum jensenii]|uniref:Uncharacterized protein n=1 Tax=Sphagnum jensenii TaxID=128206 RepID=A0ABP0V7M9_9BRYO
MSLETVETYFEAVISVGDISISSEIRDDSTDATESAEVMIDRDLPFEIIDIGTTAVDKVENDTVCKLAKDILAEVAIFEKFPDKLEKNNLNAAKWVLNDDVNEGVDELVEVVAVVDFDEDFER